MVTFLCRFHGRILLANSQVPNIVYPTCLLGRQKSLENVRKPKSCEHLAVDSPTVPHEPGLSTAHGNSVVVSSRVSGRFFDASPCDPDTPHPLVPVGNSCG